MLGVAFMAGTLVLTDTIKKSYDDVLANVYKGTDAVVRSSNEVTDGLIDGAPPDHGIDSPRRSRTCPASPARRATSRATHRSSARTARCSATPHRARRPIGASWTTVPELNPYRRSSQGTPPQRADDVVIDKHTADDGDLHVGETRSRLVEEQSRGLHDSRASRRSARPTAWAAPRSVAVRVGHRAASALGRPVRSTRSRSSRPTERRKPSSPTASRRRCPRAPRCSPATRSPRSSRPTPASRCGFINDVPDDVRDVALLVGAFMIYNTFSITVAQRTKEMALLRAIGAERKQVLRSVLAEAAVVGLFASAVGLVRRSRRCRRHQGPASVRSASRSPAVRSSSPPRRSSMALVDGHRCHGRLGLAPRSQGGEGRADRGPARHRTSRAGRSSKRRTVSGLVITGVGVAALSAGLGGAGVTLVAPRRARRVRRHRGARSGAGPSGRTRDRRSAPPAGHDRLAGPGERHAQPQAHRGDGLGVDDRRRSRRLHHDLRRLDEAVDLGQRRSTSCTPTTSSTRACSTRAGSRPHSPQR